MLTWLFNESISADLFAFVVASRPCFNSASNLLILPLFSCNSLPPSGDFVHTSFRFLRLAIVYLDDVFDAHSWNSLWDIFSTLITINCSRCLMILLPMRIYACKPEKMILENGIDDTGDNHTPFIRASMKLFWTLQSTWMLIWWMSHLSRTQKSYNQNLLYQEMSTRSGSNLVLRIPINFYSYTCNSVS